jgi:hypothetical protein
MNLSSLLAKLFKVGADAVEDVGSVLAGEGIYHSFFGKSFHQYARKKQENNPRHEFDDFCEQNLSRQEMAILNEIYCWWFAPKSEGGLGKKENDFVTLIMGYKEHKLDEIKLIIRAWASGDHRYVELKLYKLEHDWLDQDIKHDVIDPILTPLNQKISNNLARKRERRRIQMTPKSERRRSNG